MKKISYGKNIYNYKEINAVLKQLKKTTQMGVSVDSFEKKIANLFSKKYGLMVNSGSSAIILALKVLNFPKGSEIISIGSEFDWTSEKAMSKSSSIFISIDTLAAEYLRQKSNK